MRAADLTGIHQQAGVVCHTICFPISSQYSLMTPRCYVSFGICPLRSRCTHRHAFLAECTVRLSNVVWRATLCCQCGLHWRAIHLVLPDMEPRASPSVARTAEEDQAPELAVQKDALVRWYLPSAARWKGSWISGV